MPLLFYDVMAEAPPTPVCIEDTVYDPKVFKPLAHSKNTCRWDRDERQLLDDDDVSDLHMNEGFSGYEEDVRADDGSHALLYTDTLWHGRTVTKEPSDYWKHMKEEIRGRMQQWHTGACDGDISI